jgi:hypothetical protein
VSIRASVWFVSRRSILYIALLLLIVAPEIIFGRSLWTRGFFWASLVSISIAWFPLLRARSKETPYWLSGDAQAGLWRFHAVSGGAVGGDLYGEVLLEDSERLIISVFGTLYRTPFSYLTGYLSVTDRRLIMTGRSALFRRGVWTTSALTATSQLKHYDPFGLIRALILIDGDRRRFSSLGDLNNVQSLLAERLGRV